MTDRYLITALTTGQDGFGVFNDETWFTMAIGQNGAAALRYFLANGGTAPYFLEVNVPRYRVEHNGLVEIDYYFWDWGVFGNDGAGAVDARVVLPLPVDSVGGWGRGMVHTNTVDAHIIAGAHNLSYGISDTALYLTGSAKVTLADLDTQAFGHDAEVSLAGVYSAWV